MSALFAAADSSSSGSTTTFIVIALAWYLLVVVGWWKIFEKAGEQGWKAIIPIYNVFVMLKIVGRPAWWIILMLIPCVSLFVYIILMSDLSKSFNKSVGFTVGLIVFSPIFAVILGFGDSRYQGPVAVGGGPGQPPTPA
jgi:hypothetical protein